MKLVYMHESLVWFPTIRAFVVTSPSNQPGIPWWIFDDGCHDVLRSRGLRILARSVELHQED